MATVLILPQIVVGVTKFVSERFGHGGIADRMIYLNGYPFLDSKEEHTFGVPVSQCMSSRVVCIAATGMQLKHIERLLDSNAYSGFPIVETPENKTLVGYIGRTELKYAIEKAKMEQVAPGHAVVSFSSTNTSSATPPSQPSTTFDTIPATSSSTSIDLTRFIDPTPLTVHPRLPLETVMELFKKMGPRVILIEYRGRLTGLVTVKDCLKYQFKVEAGHAGAGNGEEGMERVAGWGRWVVGRLGLGGMIGKGGGELRLVSPVVARHGGGGDEGGMFAVGVDDDDEGDGDDGRGMERGLELEDRGRGR